MIGILGLIFLIKTCWWFQMRIMHVKISKLIYNAKSTIKNCKLEYMDMLHMWNMLFLVVYISFITLIWSYEQNISLNILPYYGYGYRGEIFYCNSVRIKIRVFMSQQRNLRILKSRSFILLHLMGLALCVRHRDAYRSIVNRVLS